MSNQVALLSSSEKLQSNSSSQSCTLRQNYPLRQANSPISLRQSTKCNWYKNSFGQLVVWQKRQWTSFDGNTADDTPAQSETTWTFTPSFLSRCVVLRSRNAFGLIERSFRMWPVIPYRHPVWRMCKRQSLAFIRTLFSERAVSPFIVDTSGKTLLHVSNPILE